MLEFDIFNPNKRHVLCADNKDNNWSFDDNASKYLEVGKVYHVSNVEVHDWHTRVTVEEFPNRQFSSTHFLEITMEIDKK